MRCASRVSPAIARAIVRLDDPSRPIAETARRVNAFAEENGDIRTSYERLRQLVHAHRDYRANLGASAARIIGKAIYEYNYPLLLELLEPRETRRKLR
jgi:hypothetical protein